MSLLIKNFSGIIPRLDETELPDLSAQTAHNCDLVSGTLRPINANGPFVNMAENGVLKSDLNTDNVFSIDIPEKPSLVSKGHLAENMETWIQLRKGDYVSWVDDDGNSGDFHRFWGYRELWWHGNSAIQDTFKSSKELWVYPESVRYTDTGAELSFSIPNIWYYLEANRTYTILPYYEMRLFGNFDNGGPDNDVNMPYQVNNDYNQFLPNDRIALTRNGNPGDIYGYLEIVDSDRSQGVYGPETILPRSNGFVTYNYAYRGWPNHNITIKLDLNYIQKSRQFFHYVQTNVVDRGEHLVESEPSEISEKITVMPGEYVNLNTPISSGYTKNNIYRSGSSGDDFRLIKEADSNTWKDYFDLPLLEELPLFGNVPDAPIGDFLEGSILHPAQFGVAYLNKILYFSDFNKFHVWPEEFQLEFNDDIKAIALSGNTIAVFAGDYVYGVSGGNPAFMSKYLLSNTAPMLSKLSLARINSNIFYVSQDGIFVVSGGSVRNLTSNYYTRNEWLNLSPGTFKSKVADNSIFLEGDVVNLRLDFDEDVKFLTTFTTTSNAGDFTWKSKKFHFTQKEIFDYCKVDADAEVSIKVFADGVLKETLKAENYNPVIFNKLDYGYDWEFELSSSSELRSFEVFQRDYVDMGDMINLTPENNQAWRLSWLKFPDSGSFAGGICTSESGEPVQIEFFHETLNLVHIENVFSGRVFKLPTTLPGGNLWRVSLPNNDHTVTSLILFSRRRQIIQKTIHEFRTDPNVQPWALKTYESQKPLAFSCAQIHATSYPVILKFYANDTLIYNATVNDSNAFRLPRARMERVFSVEVEEGTGFVNELAISSSMAGLKG